MCFPSAGDRLLQQLQRTTAVGVTGNISLSASGDRTMPWGIQSLQAPYNRWNLVGRWNQGTIVAWNATAIYWPGGSRAAPPSSNRIRIGILVRTGVCPTPSPDPNPRLLFGRQIRIPRLGQRGAKLLLQV